MDIMQFIDDPDLVEAFGEGEEAFANGESRSANPYVGLIELTERKKHAWSAGWAAAWETEQDAAHEREVEYDGGDFVHE